MSKLDRIIELLNDPEPMVREEARRLLMRYGKQNSREAGLVGLGNNENDPEPFTRG